MTDSSSAAARLPWRLVAGVATLVVAMLLAYVAAHWGWRWFGPAPAVAPVSAASDQWAAAIVAVPLFGRVDGSTASPPGSTSGVVLQGETRLLGVFAGRDGEGYALFRLADRGPVLARTGQEIAKDVTLEAVRPDGVRIRDRGETRDIVLRASTAEASTANASAAPAAPRSRAACSAPPGYKGPVYRINAELLGGMAARPETWHNLFAPGSAGLIVRDESGFASLLGLKAGDRLTSASGIGLAAIDDMLVAVVRPLQASQPVRVTGIRDGKSLEWLLVNAAACAG